MAETIETMNESIHALDLAINIAGGVGALADRIKVAASAPSMWRKRGRVPAEHCPLIERETGVRCEDLRPDVVWNVLRANQVDADMAQPAKAAA